MKKIFIILFITLLCVTACNGTSSYGDTLIFSEENGETSPSFPQKSNNPTKLIKIDSEKITSLANHNNGIPQVVFVEKEDCYYISQPEYGSYPQYNRGKLEYYNRTGYTDELEYLYRISRDFEKNEKIGDIIAVNLQTDGKSLYFIENAKLKNLKNNGEVEIIYKGSIDDYFLENGYIYIYVSGVQDSTVNNQTNAVTKIDINTKKAVSKFELPSRPSQIINGKIYYIIENKIYEMEEDNHTIIYEANDLILSFLFYKDSMIVELIEQENNFNFENYLYLPNEDRVAIENFTKYNIFDESIYFISKDDNILWRYDLNSQEKELLIKEDRYKKLGSIFICGDILFFDVFGGYGSDPKNTLSYYFSNLDGENFDILAKYYAPSTQRIYLENDSYSFEYPTGFMVHGFMSYCHSQIIDPETGIIITTSMKSDDHTTEKMEQKITKTGLSYFISNEDDFSINVRVNEYFVNVLCPSGMSDEAEVIITNLMESFIVSK